MGPFGSGKSVASVMKIMKYAMAQEPNAEGIRKTRFAIVRNTYEQLKDTTMKTFFDWIPDGVAGRYAKTDKIFYLGSAPITHRPGEMKRYMRLPDGTYIQSEILFRALDRPDQLGNLLSLELTGAWLNEYREIPYDIYEALSGRVGRYPSKGDVPATWSGIWMDTNPPNTDSEYYKLFETTDAKEELLLTLKKHGMSEADGKMPEFTLFKQPSGLSPQAENINNLDGGRMYYVKMMAAAQRRKRGNNWINIHIHGKYGFQLDGKAVYADQYDDDIHVSKVPLKPNAAQVMGIGLDFGLTPAAVFGQLSPMGQWLIFGELVAENMAIVEFSKRLRNYVEERFPGMSFRIYGDPAGMQRSQVDARSAFDVLRADGWIVYPGEQSPQLRYDSVRAGLTRLVGGEPGFLLDPSCAILRQGFSGGYHYRRIKVAGERYDNVPNKNKYSHPHDGLQYLMSQFEAPAMRGGQRLGFPGADAANPDRHKPYQMEEWSVF